MGLPAPPRSMPQKECPSCRAYAPLEAKSCARCGHIYKTQFVVGVPLSENPAFGVPSAAPPPALLRRNVLPFGALVLAAIAALCVVASLIFLIRAVPRAGSVNPPGVATPNEIQTLRLQMSPRQTVLNLGRPLESHGDIEADGQQTWRYRIIGGGDALLTFQNVGGVVSLTDITESDSTGLVVYHRGV